MKEDGRPGPLHLALEFAGLLGRLSPLVLTPAWLALAAVACWPWDNLRLPVALLALAFTLFDGVSLALLPRFQRSFGDVTPPLFALACLRTIILFGLGLISATTPVFFVGLGLNAAIAAVAVYATWIEPFRVGVTRMTLQSSKLSGAGPLRILHLSDIHIERISPRDRAVLREVQRLSPDAVVLTGDYFNLSSIDDPHAHAAGREWMAELCAVAHGPVYAVTGSPRVDRADVVPGVFEGLPVNWLHDETDVVELGEHRIRLIGLRCANDRSVDVPRLRRLTDGWVDGSEFSLLLYHSPDLMPEAVDLGIDLYLCGHTHGGQIRFPLIGALLTSSEFWKRYEMGRYDEDGSTLYVSRGLGVEGLGAPRARFLAPPEIVLWELTSEKSLKDIVEA